MKTLRVVGGALCAIACSIAAVAAPGVELRPGVVRDGSGSTLYVMEPEGGIAALDLATGTTRWSSDAAARPLYADDEVLVAQVEMPGRHGMLHLAVFDVRRPDATPATASVEMPVGTQALVVAGRRATFDLWATRSGDTVLVGWMYSSFEKTAVESASRNAAARTTTSGAVRVPLGRGPVREIDSADAPNPKRAPLPVGDVPALDGFDAKMAERSVGGGVRPAGDTFVLVDLPNGDPRQPARVRRWQADGKSLGAMELFGDGYFVKNRSADGRYLLGSRAVGTTASAAWQWSLVDLATGRPVTAFRHADPAAAFLVMADQVIVDAPARGRRVGDEWVEQSLSVQALDLATGAVRWSHAVRDTAWSGDLPPAR